MFVVGAWDRLPLLAQAISGDLERFAAGNPLVHASAGIAVVDGHFPLYRGAHEAAEALDQAKDHRRAGETRARKQAMTLLGQTVGWESAPAVVATVERAWRAVERHGAPRALVHTLGAIAESYERTRAEQKAQPGQPVFGRWMWLRVYALTRLAARAKGETAKEIEALQGDALTLAPHLRLIARWAELLLRKEGSNRADA